MCTAAANGLDVKWCAVLRWTGTCDTVEQMSDCWTLRGEAAEREFLAVSLAFKAGTVRRSTVVRVRSGPAWDMSIIGEATIDEEKLGKERQCDEMGGWNANVGTTVGKHATRVLVMMVTYTTVDPTTACYGSIFL